MSRSFEVGVGLVSPTYCLIPGLMTHITFER